MESTGMPCVTMLVIGLTQNAKSTLINRLANTSVNNQFRRLSNCPWKSFLRQRVPNTTALSGKLRRS